MDITQLIVIRIQIKITLNFDSSLEQKGIERNVTVNEISTEYYKNYNNYQQM